MDTPPSFRPGDESEVAAFLRERSDAGAPVVVRGGGSKAGFGRAHAGDHQAGNGQAGNVMTLDLGALSGIVLYEPDELVLTALAGTPLSEIADAVAARRQYLAFEPPEFGALFKSGGASTLGGAAASGWSGPRRIKAGAVRDHVLGMRAVGGDGEIFKSGGRVVKNVTGFDLPKLLTGSHGTLAVMTEITIKVMPAPEQVLTIAIFGSEPADAIQLLCGLLGGPYEVAGATHLPAGAACRSRVAAIAERGTSATLIRLEGFGPSVLARSAAIGRLFAERHAVRLLDGAESDAAWQEIRDVAPLIDPEQTLWRVSLPATSAAALVAKIAQRAPVEAYYDWGGNLVWLSLPCDDHAQAALIRGVLPSGHATLMRAPDSIKAAAPIFQPQARPLAELASRVRSAFDPNGILSPGPLQAEC